MKGYLFAFGLIGILLLAGCAGYTQSAQQAPQQSAQDKAMAEKKAMEEKAAMEQKAMAEKKEMDDKNAIIKNNSANGSMAEKKESTMEESKASYSNYNAAAYQKAKSDGKVIYLEFYASWCPICRAYEPRLLSGFETMAADSKYNDVVGFRVNYDTQDDLKREFGIVGQHTHVIIGKDSSVVVKSREDWGSQDLMDNIGKAL